jgi:hypothetical protein
MVQLIVENEWIYKIFSCHQGILGFFFFPCSKGKNKMQRMKIFAKIVGVYVL